LHGERLENTWIQNWQKFWRNGRRKWIGRNAKERETGRNSAIDQNATGVTRHTAAIPDRVHQITEPIIPVDVVVLDTGTAEEATEEVMADTAEVEVMADTTEVEVMADMAEVEVTADMVEVEVTAEVEEAMEWIRRYLIHSICD
jgi:hypothetical protein